ncbi:hypothetical protein PBY51_024845 [Eleginops maclovinus]|uniref:Uncharacterized protein n=1 Tax=Eleginops maclovinus TaxID=56733 RepID=A0AAN7Y1T9_ELEMC|nr:hypothetical protein PBY51_024845 [Eleginops maclovinus]
MHRLVSTTGGLQTPEAPARLQRFVGPAVYSHSLHFWSFISSPSRLGGFLSLSPRFCASQFGVRTAEGF